MKSMMKTGLTALAALACGLSAAAAAPLIVLGDSTVDAGSARIASGGTVADPDEGYFAGRFTNGPNVADYVNLALNGELTTSYLLGGLNRGFGGAAIVTDVNQGPGGLPPGIPDLIDQVNQLLAAGPIASDADLFISFAGNDFLAVSAGVADPDLVVAQAIANMAIQLERLATGGATNVVVSNVSSAGFALGGDFVTAAAVQSYNAQLSALLVDLSLSTGTRFALADRDGVVSRIIADPLAFGFNPAVLSLPCQAVPEAVPDCSGFLSFDGTHLTTQAAALIADEVLAAIAQPVPLPGALALFATGLAGLTVVRRRAR